MGRTQKITLSFPRTVAEALKKRVKKGKRSRFVAEAVREKIEAEKKAKLRAELKEGYKARTSLHKQLAEEFYVAEEEAYEKSVSDG